MWYGVFGEEEAEDSSSASMSSSSFSPSTPPKLSAFGKMGWGSGGI